VTLDDLLGGGPIQHREVQGHESALFLSYFKDGIQYLDGGVESGFNHVDPDAYEPRLFQVKGKRNVRVQQVEKTVNSLNDGDTFILDLGHSIYQWNGSKSNKFERFKALEMVQKIKDQERGGKPAAIYLEAGQNDTGAEAEAFWAQLGGSSSQVKDESAGGSDEDPPRAESRLLRVSDDGASFSEVAVGSSIEQSQLDSSAVFIVDSGAEVFVWVGKKASKESRASGMTLAQGYLNAQGRPSWTPISRLIESGETPIFKAVFSRGWKVAERGPSIAAPKVAARQADVDEPIDAAALARSKAASDTGAMVDDGTGETQVWRIRNFAKEAVSAEECGQFFSGDAYIILYTYMKKSKKCYIIYFWQGQSCSADERGTSALLATELDDSLRGEPQQVRVVQGKEPNHFLLLFKGKFVVHKGGYDSGFNKTGAVVAADASESNIHLYVSLSTISF
jgi:hypothetical protein